MEFNYNFDICPICDSKIEFDDHNVAKCLMGCCTYDVDPQGETVSVI